jgi:beta-phosphoglucomutase-like phosphatase (HAD superfamily)
VSIEAVVFDLDGVIIDSEEVWEEVRRGYAAEHGREFLPDTQDRLMGMSTGEWSRHLAEEVGVPRTPEEVAADVLGRMAERYRDDLPLIEGSVEAVRRIGDRYPLALASSSSRILIDQVLATAGLTDAFAVTLSTEEVPRGKPFPDVYLAAADKGNRRRPARRSRTPATACGRRARPVSPSWPSRTASTRPPRMRSQLRALSCRIYAS